MQATAFGSVRVSAHERTQFGACPSMPVDAELDYTYHEVNASIHKAPSTVSPVCDRADSYTCKELQFIWFSHSAGAAGHPRKKIEDEYSYSRITKTVNIRIRE